jgi:hypothetical protein
LWEVHIFEQEKSSMRLPHDTGLINLLMIVLGEQFARQHDCSLSGGEILGANKYLNIKM